MTDKTFFISVNTTDVHDVTNPGAVIPAEAKVNPGFIDLYYTDPESNKKTRISINSAVLTQIIKQNQLEY